MNGANRRWKAWLLGGVALALALLAAPNGSGAPPLHGPEGDAERRALLERAAEAVEEKRFEAALGMYEHALERKPLDPLTRYNLACVRAQLGQVERAEQDLLDALSIGFVDLHHLAKDAHLDPIRGGRVYEAIVTRWRELLDKRGDLTLDALRKIYRSGYLFERDEALRLLYASWHDPETLDDVQADLDRLASWAFVNVFTDLNDDDAESLRPDPWVAILLPTPEDFVRAAASPDVGGWYDHDTRRLISQDVGPSLRHEFMHALHWRDMTRRGQRHPEWIMEGLGCLVEDIDLAPDGALVPAPSWRTNIVKRLEGMSRLEDWDRLMTMPRERFVGIRPSARYAQARSVMMFLYDRSVLAKWYRAYVSGFDEDPTGVEALERVFGAPLAQIERLHKAWVADLPEVAERIEPGMASLQVRLGAGRGDGPVIQRVPPGSAGAKAGLRMGEVIVGIDAQPVRTREGLIRRLGERRAGDRVRLDLRRGSVRRSVEVVLEAHEDEPTRPIGPAWIR